MPKTPSQPPGTTARKVGPVYLCPAGLELGFVVLERGRRLSREQAQQLMWALRDYLDATSVDTYVAARGKEATPG